MFTSPSSPGPCLWRLSWAIHSGCDLSSFDAVDEFTSDTLAAACRDTDMKVCGMEYEFRRRHSACWQRTNSLAFDFDGTLPLADALAWLSLAGCSYFLKTSRSHQAPVKDGKPIAAADRFHVLLPLSRAITDPEEHAAVYRYLLTPELDSIEATAIPFRRSDANMTDRARMLRGSLPSSVVQWHDSGTVLDVDAVLVKWQAVKDTLPVSTARTANLVPINFTGDADPAELDAWIAAHPRQWNGFKGEAGRIWRDEVAKGKDTYRVLFSGVLSAYARFPSKVITARLIQALPEAAEFFHRKPGQLRDLPQTIDNAARLVIDDCQALAPVRPWREVMPTVDLAVTPLPQTDCDRLAALLQVPAVNGQLVGAIRAGLAAGPTVISAACGEGKSIGATVAVALDTARRFLIVKDTLAAIDEQRAALDKLGTPVTVLCGWRADKCRNSKREPRPRAYYGGKSPCRKCRARGACDFALTQKHKANPFGQQRVTIMTHARLVTMLGAETIPAGLSIIIDEQPDVFSAYSFNPRDLLAAMQRVYGGAAFRGEVQALAEALEVWCRDRGTHTWLPEQWREDGMQFARKLIPHAYKVAKTTKPTDDDLDALAEFSGFFRHACGSIKAIAGKAGEWHLMAFSVDLLHRLVNPVILLSASADFAPVQMLGFSKWQLPSNRIYSNTTVHPLAMNPTQSSLERRLATGEYQAAAEAAIPGGATVFLAENKNPSPAVEKFRKGLERKGHKVIAGKRGSIIGSNEFRDCDAAILPMGLFTSIEGYALAASLVFGRNIRRSELFADKGGKSYPRMHGGFDCPEVADVFDRMTADETMQTLLRVNVRSNPAARCNLVPPVHNAAVEAQLRRMLPGATWAGVDDVARYLDGLPTVELCMADARSVHKGMGKTGGLPKAAAQGIEGQIWLAVARRFGVQNGGLQSNKAPIDCSIPLQPVVSDWFAARYAEQLTAGNRVFAATLDWFLSTRHKLPKGWKHTPINGGWFWIHPAAVAPETAADTVMVDVRNGSPVVIGNDDALDRLARLDTARQALADKLEVQPVPLTWTGARVPVTLADLEKLAA